MARYNFNCRGSVNLEKLLISDKEVITSSISKTISFRFLKSLEAPNQHHSFGTCSGEPGNTGLSPLPGASSHIHSKTACRGFKSFCPCQKQRYCFCSGAVFCHWAERLGNEVRPQARLRCVSWGECVPVARKLRADRGGSRDKSVP